MKHHDEKRTNSFLWESRQELYDYFKTAYSLSKTEVDIEIDIAMSNFRFRTGQAINTKELWQKVGMALERKLAGTKKNIIPPPLVSAKSPQSSR
jgi:hypothetical protein